MAGFEMAATKEATTGPTKMAFVFRNAFSLRSTRCQRPDSHMPHLPGLEAVGFVLRFEETAKAFVSVSGLDVTHLP